MTPPNLQRPSPYETPAYAPLWADNDSKIGIGDVGFLLMLGSRVLLRADPARLASRVDRVLFGSLGKADYALGVARVLRTSPSGSRAEVVPLISELAIEDALRTLGHPGMTIVIDTATMRDLLAKARAIG